MTRLAEGGRAARPGLACRWWHWRRACANRKARIQAAARKVWLERLCLPGCTCTWCLLCILYGDPMEHSR